MSYDIQLATARKPAPEHVEDWIRTRSDIRVSDATGPNGMGLVIHRRGLFRRGAIATADGPIHAEAGDLSDTLLSGLLSPRWLMEFQLHGSSVQSDLPVIEALAIHLARACDGAVFDPQRELLLWPVTPVREAVRRSDRRIPLITLKWFLPTSRLVSPLPSELLEVLRDVCPKALPRRYGTYEPLQHRFEGDGADAAFAAFWDEEATVVHGSTFFWTTTRPVLGGSATLPDQRDIYRPPGVRRVASLDLDIDGSTVGSQPAWLERTVEVFRAVAERFDAVFAHAYVRRNVLLKRQIWFTPDSEQYPLPKGGWFRGLPAVPTWLAWYGPAYRTEIEASLPEAVTTRVGPALLVRWGNEPMNLDALRSVPQLDPRLVVPDPEADGRPAEFVPQLE
ncbi:MAG: hypothetical protein AABZ33_00365 [Chloroflexota bacterium]